ncbi:ABC transporter permease [Lactobacillus kalixensis]|uniref:Glycine betaine choline ABC superfamily ATP binding cassette transporter, membrane protein n=1 Tax=Lactobacillus kalixensis DSM 16043 TaxID=1423763 RepID=A0A0R1U902_9LACO|nr:ABC transporter permease [Lactobacillus kalixensis]KRL89805.1 glycine betaine choline ABC superfamily ATP binding cassette transporter, membrane protein [Lactobacillus kalixensis DSM 16043]
MIKYWQENSQHMILLASQHGQMVLAALLIAFVIAVVIIYFCLRKENWLNSLIYVFSLLYSVPSYAFFALLIPVTGLGTTTAIIVLACYNEYVLLRTFITGIRGVDPDYIEVAKGLGMTDREVFFKVQLPLAMPSIFSGLQVALASTMAIATIASTISAGGLGDLMFEGLQTNNAVPILWGTILTIALTLIFIVILNLIKTLILSEGLTVKENYHK